MAPELGVNVIGFVDASSMRDGGLAARRAITGAGARR
jgi:hypothetical protein